MLLVTMSLALVPFSLLIFESRLVCLRSLSLLLQAIDLRQRWPFLLFELAMMVVYLPTLMQSSSSWAWLQHLSAVSSVWQAKSSCQQVLEAIQQASYCPSRSHSYGSLFPITAQYPCSPISCDLDVGRV